MRIIGLTGRARAGKDTAAGFILKWCADRGIRAERVALADPLKVSAAAALGFDTTPRPGMVEDAVAFCDDLKQEGCRITVQHLNHSELGPRVFSSPLVSGREYLQRYGTEAHRGVFGDDFWIKVTEDRLNKMAGAAEVAVITDVRFDNEAMMVRRYEGENWYVQRPAGEEEISTGLEHTSEAGVSANLLDERLLNYGTREEFEAVVHALCDMNINLQEGK